MRVVAFSRALTLILLLTASPMVSLMARAGDCNATVLREIGEMPQGGEYAITPVATIALMRATHFESGKFFVLPSPDSPSFCSGATYLVFLKTIEELRRQGRLKLDAPTLAALVIHDGQRDGEGVWGRWNANGPGTARLFHELRLGTNSTDFATAEPGDFMKIFWTPEVGSTEHGHSVVYLGTELRDGEQYVRFWSSNEPAGYGEKSVPRATIAHVIFSRLESPENLVRIKYVPETDQYLASLLTRRSSFAEAQEMCGF
ncbi:MAG: hypothetical protein ABSE62_09460 [Chthoniobacteraceae bacterium]|jgi:hypothetical protein